MIESEETEVKNIEWLREKVDDLQFYSNPEVQADRNDPYTQYVEGVNDTVRRVKKLLNQLDEPEVLSQKLPAIPKFVAEWYESEGKCSSWWNWFYKWGRDESRSDLETKTIKWMQDYNEEKFIDMFLHGYTVEEEQKYIVRLPSSMQDSFPIVALGRINKGNLSVRKNRVGTNLTLHDKYQLTEQEIKDYDPRYMTFAKPVEELEE